MRRRSVASVLGVVVLGSGVAVLAGATPAMAANETAVVSLGDSFISGEAGRWLGNSDKWTGSRNGTDRAYDPSTDTYDPEKIYGSTYKECDRSDVAEVSPTSLPVPFDHYINVACSGATTDAIWTPFKDQVAQADLLADAAKTYQIKTVVLSIGGNDLDISGILETCGKDFIEWKSACTSDGSAQKQVDEALATLPDKVDKAIDTIKSTMRAAGYQDGSYQFVLQGYPSTLPDSDHVRYDEGYDRYRVGGCPFYNSDLDWVRGRLTTEIDDALAGMAKRAGVEFLDLRDTLAGREICSTTTDLVDDQHPVSLVTSEWARFVAGRDQGIPQESLHPNAIAQYALGFCLGLLVKHPADRVRCVNTPGEDYHSMKLVG